MKKTLQLAACSFILIISSLNAYANCNPRLTQSHFNQTIQQISVLNNEQIKLNKAKQFLRTNCVNTGHVISLMNHLQNDQNRLHLAKVAFPLVNDAHNYNLVSQNLMRVTNRRELNAFTQRRAYAIKPNNRPDYRPNNNRNAKVYVPQKRYEQPLNKHDFDRMIVSLDNERFESNRLDLLNTIIANLPPLTTNQISIIVNRFRFDSNRLEAAKIAYKACIDKHNYYQISNQMSFSSNKRELLNFIRTH